MNAYLNLLRNIYHDGVDKSDRTGVGTRSIFGAQLRFNLKRGFPLVTTKKMHLKSIIHELLWMLSGSTNVKYLQENGVRIWNEWADENGDLGPVYGKQWRKFSRTYIDGGERPVRMRIDQIQNAIDMIKTNPDSRRNLVMAWDPSEIDKMKLPPCHFCFQFAVINGHLSCHMNMRSADMFLGVPFNIASYALLTQMVAQHCRLALGELIVSFGDVHIYRNHFDQVEEQLSRDPLPWPDMVISERPTVFDHEYEDFELIGYKCHPSIKAEVAV